MPGSDPEPRSGTDPREELEHLQERLSHLPELFRDVPVGLYRATPEGEVLEANPAFARLLGLEPDEVVGTSLPSCYVDPDDWEAWIARIRARGVVHGVEAALGRADGSVVWLRQNARAHVDDDGTLLHYEGVAEDVTERRKAEEALQDRAAELARAKAEFEQFAYIASHDLQEPLRMVASYVQLLDRRYADQLDEDAQAYIGYAAEGAQRMSMLLRDVLAYTELGIRDLQREPVNLEQALASVQKDLAGPIERSGAQVTHDPLPTVLGDREQLCLLFEHLLTNAIKFNPEGQAPTIHVSAGQGPRAWEITVDDEGIGIDPEHAHRIFQVFQRLHPRDAYPGTGIGLAICKTIVERHGGQIRVEPAGETGARFAFTIPRPDPAAGEETLGSGQAQA